MSMRVGWAAAGCQLGGDGGGDGENEDASGTVGCAPGSWAVIDGGFACGTSYEANRSPHSAPQSAGEWRQLALCDGSGRRRWQPGDVLGMAADLRSRTLLTSLNGHWAGDRFGDNRGSTAAADAGNVAGAAAGNVATAVAEVFRDATTDEKQSLAAARVLQAAFLQPCFERLDLSRGVRPAVSLPAGAAVALNFGETPFQFAAPSAKFRPVAESNGTCFCC